MWPAALKALDDIGIGEARRRGDGWVDINGGTATALWTPAGRALLRRPGGVDLKIVSRPALLATLADGVDISFSTHIENLDQLDDADVVVGADGTFSRTRQQLFGDRSSARELGAVAWRGTIRGAVREVLDRVDEDGILHHGLFETPRLGSFVSGHRPNVWCAPHAWWATSLCWAADAGSATQQSAPSPKVMQFSR